MPTGSGQSALPPNANPEDVFEVLPEDRGNFTIVSGGEGSPPGEWFTAVRPPPGSDSSSFVALPPNGAGDAATRPITVSPPAGFTTIESAGATPEGWPLRIRCETDDASMAFVPGGLFLMGHDGSADHALPAHPVELDPFYIDVTEVTVGRYREFMAAQREQRRLIPDPANVDAPPNHPVLGVEWGEAIRYADWAGKSLPTEAEWELAGRGPDSFDCPWGNGRAVWDGPREVGQIDAVGTFSTDRSIYRVLDMAGNAQEWVLDFYGEDIADPSRTRGGAAVKNPSGPRRASRANHRVLKGGGPQWKLWHRSSASMSDPPANVGFRCVLRVTRSGSNMTVRHLDPDEAPPRSGPSRQRNPRFPSRGLGR